MRAGRRIGRRMRRPYKVGEVVRVGGPAGGIVGDVAADAAECLVVADDVFVVVALPDGGFIEESGLIRLFRDCGFEGADDGSNRAASWPAWGSPMPW